MNWGGNWSLKYAIEDVLSHFKEALEILIVDAYHDTFVSQ
jgi:hypothetical protein